MKTRSGNSSKGNRRASALKPASSLEMSIGRLAQSGDLAKAAERAIRRQRRKRIAITFQRGEEIIKRHADGREESLGRVAAVGYQIPKGVKVIRTRINGDA